MENASKALIIAGGVLLGIITISLFTFMFNNISKYVNETSEDYQSKEVLASNQSFEAYYKKVMYGTDIISVLNKAIDNNTKFNVVAGDNSGYSVDVVIKFKTNIEDVFMPTISGYSLKNNKDLLKENIIDPIVNRYSNTVASEFKRKAFQCEKIEYNNKTGRVSKMIFTEK